MNLYDVSNPKAPTPFAQGIGDSTANGQGKKDANETHSVFAWDAGDKAYAVIVDNEEGTDVDIMDITDPKKRSSPRSTTWRHCSRRSSRLARATSTTSSCTTWWSSRSAAGR